MKTPKYMRDGLKHEDRRKARRRLRRLLGKTVLHRMKLYI